ncbi:hypothetical protein IV203_008571 [Nitzschia inconspicua]|uniref:Uncharacterized protein n=1 Tax=Nitzschia inconspicua TaxID=303405 RepID=A0A9K3KYZ5_9STRA|nr:hypothetical protein IV203_008571 [Nitzschia inconspicua]
MAPFGFHPQPSQENLDQNKNVTGRGISKERHHPHASQGSDHGRQPQMYRVEHCFQPSVEFQPGERPQFSVGSHSYASGHYQNDPFGGVELSQMTTDTASYRSQQSRSSTHTLISAQAPRPTGDGIPMRQPSGSSLEGSSYPSRIRKQVTGQQFFSPPMHQDSQSSHASSSSSRRGILLPSSRGSSASGSGKRARFCCESKGPLPRSQQYLHGQDDASIQQRSSASLPPSLRFSSTFSSDSSSMSINGQNHVAPQSNNNSTSGSYFFNKLLTKKLSNVSTARLPRNPGSSSIYKSNEILPRRSIPQQPYPAKNQGNVGQNSVSVGMSRSEGSDGHQQQEYSPPTPQVGLALLEEDQIRQFEEKLKVVMELKTQEYQRRLEEENDRKKQVFERQIDDIETSKLQTVESNMDATLEKKVKKKTTKVLAMINEKVSESEARIDGRTEGSLAQICDKLASCMEKLDKKQKTILASIQETLQSTFFPKVARAEASLNEKISWLKNLPTSSRSVPFLSTDNMVARPTVSPKRRSKKSKRQKAEQPARHEDKDRIMGNEFCSLPSDSHPAVKEPDSPTSEAIEPSHPRQRSKRRNALVTARTGTPNAPASPPPVESISWKNGGELTDSSEEHDASNEISPERIHSQTLYDSIVSPKLNDSLTDLSLKNASDGNHLIGGEKENRENAIPTMKKNALITSKANVLQSVRKPTLYKKTDDFQKTGVASHSNNVKSESRASTVSDINLTPKPTLRKETETKLSVESKAVVPIDRSYTPKMALTTPTTTSFSLSAKRPNADTTSNHVLTPKAQPFYSQKAIGSSPRRILTITFDSCKTTAVSMETSQNSSPLGGRQLRKRKASSPLREDQSQTAAKRTMIDHAHGKKIQSVCQTTLFSKVVQRKPKNVSPKTFPKKIGSGRKTKNNNKSPDWLENPKPLVFSKRNHQQTFSKRTERSYYEDDGDDCFDFRD